MKVKRKGGSCKRNKRKKWFVCERSLLYFAVAAVKLVYIPCAHKQFIRFISQLLHYHHHHRITLDKKFVVGVLYVCGVKSWVVKLSLQSCSFHHECTCTHVRTSKMFTFLRSLQVVCVRLKYIFLHFFPRASSPTQTKLSIIYEADIFLFTVYKFHISLGK